MTILDSFLCHPKDFVAATDHRVTLPLSPRMRRDCT
jgi:hypothetical protein